jgi:hypothetical protein
VRGKKTATRRSWSRPVIGRPQAQQEQRGKLRSCGRRCRKRGTPCTLSDASNSREANDIRTQSPWRITCLCIYFCVLLCCHLQLWLNLKRRFPDFPCRSGQRSAKLP